MNIIFSGPEVQELRGKYTVLELDTFRLPPEYKTVTAYAVVDTIPITEVHRIQEFADLHNNLIQNYKKKNWKYCEDAIEHLVGAWNGELRSFYEILSQRIDDLKTQDPGSDWDGTLTKG